jgi:hypothetical protein
MSASHSIYTISLTATAAIKAQTLVDFTGATALAGGNTAGVARTSGNYGDLVPVDRLGSSVVLAGAAIAAGSRVQSDANGNVIPWVTGKVAVGVAMEPAVNAGQAIECDLIPN